MQLVEPAAAVRRPKEMRNFCKDLSALWSSFSRWLVGLADAIPQAKIRSFGAAETRLLNERARDRRDVAMQSHVEPAGQSCAAGI